MKKIVGIFFAHCLLFSLTACSRFVEDTYYAVTPHTVAPVSESSGVITIENYRELVNALLQFVTEEQESGLIRLSNYDRDTAWSQLATASTEILEETALGSYGVVEITWDTNTIMSYLEAEVAITYREGRTDFGDIIQVNGTSAIGGLIESSLVEFSPNLILENVWSSSDRNQISRILAQSTKNVVGDLVELPEVHVSFYPKEGPWRILELDFFYTSDLSTLLLRQEALEEEISSLVSGLWSLGVEERYESMIFSLKEHSVYSPQGDTPYDILVVGQGNGQGYAYSFLALCQEMGLPCEVIEGTFMGNAHQWNAIPWEEEMIYLDLCQPMPEEGGFPYYFEEDLLAVGYVW